ncbi:MAG: M15 family metallopeptidase [Bacteroidia bacterium]|jgi:hypothetical protein
MIKEFKASNFEGYNGEKIMLDEEVHPRFIKMNDVAAKHGIIVVVMDSIRHGMDVVGAVVPPSKMSNHFIGYAIDFNLKKKSTGEWFNNAKLRDDKGPDEAFCIEVVDTCGLRWGDAFKKKDAIHFDVPLNITNPVLWHVKYKAIKAEIQ